MAPPSVTAARSRPRQRPARRAGARAPAPAPAGDGPFSSAQDLVANDSFIVKTGSVTVEVPAIDAALLKARAAIIGLGGYISGSDQANQGDQDLASVTYRIPAARWEEALDAIRALATKVVAVKTGTTEVTGQVIDLGARIDNLKATEQALQAIMVKALKIQDILDVQNQLTGVRGQIEELTTEQTHLAATRPPPVHAHGRVPDADYACGSRDPTG